LVANILHWGLFGTLSVQLYLYYQAFPNDRLFIKCLVYGVYVIELMETILVTYDAFATFGYGFGDLTALTEPGLYWFNIPVMTALVSFMGQSFYAYRLHVLSKLWVLPGLTLIVSNPRSPHLHLVKYLQ
ncbi:hypothetical protein C8R44DRAFT_643563, partial [Mycena epipterygia]